MTKKDKIKKMSELFPHLSEEKIKDSIEFNQVLPKDEIAVDYVKQLNEELNITQPNTSKGYRMNQIDAIQNSTGVVRDKMIASLERTAPITSSETSLERNLSKSEIEDELINLASNDSEQINAHLSQNIVDDNNLETEPQGGVPKDDSGQTQPNQE